MSKLFDLESLKKATSSSTNPTNSTIPLTSSSSPLSISSNGSLLLSNYLTHQQLIHSRNVLLANQYNKIHQEIGSKVNTYWLKQQSEWNKLKPELDSLPLFHHSISNMTKDLAVIANNLECLNDAYEIIIAKRENELIQDWTLKKDRQLGHQKAMHETIQREAQSKYTQQQNNLANTASNNIKLSEAKRSSTTMNNLSGLTSSLEAQVKNFMSINIKKFVLKKPNDPNTHNTTTNQSVPSTPQLLAQSNSPTLLGDSNQYSLDSLNVSTTSETDPVNPAETKIEESNTEISNNDDSTSTTLSQATVSESSVESSNATPSTETGTETKLTEAETDKDISEALKPTEDDITNNDAAAKTETVSQSTSKSVAKGKGKQKKNKK